VTWWAWTLLWVVLVAGALGVFFLIGRSLWRKVRALAGELGTASDRLSAVAGELQTLAEKSQGQDLAVFSDPTRLRQERILAGRARARGRKRGSRSARSAAPL
jgi:hypothetical protein